MLATLQKRLPQELRPAGITGIDAAEGKAFVPFAGALDDILCVQEERLVRNDNTARYKRLTTSPQAARPTLAPPSPRAPLTRGAIAATTAGPARCRQAVAKSDNLGNRRGSKQLSLYQRIRLRRAS